MSGNACGVHAVGDVAGAVGGYAGRGALAYTGAPAGADGLRHAAHRRGFPRFSVDSGATRGGTAATARPTVTWAYSPLRRDTAVGANRPCRPGSRAGLGESRAIAGGGAHHAVGEPAGVQHRGRGVCGAVCVAGHQPKHIVELGGGQRLGLAGVLVSLAAIAAAGTTIVLLVRWLVARRAAAFMHQGLPERRSARELWAGCLLPMVNLLWAPLYVIELALVEDRYTRLRRPIVVWWIVWIVSNAISMFAFATSWVTDAQGIANNTTMMVLAYLCAAAAVAAAARVFEGFEQKPVERPAHRWVVVNTDGRSAPASSVAVELDGQEPAA